MIAVTDEGQVAVIVAVPDAEGRRSRRTKPPVGSEIVPVLHDTRRPRIDFLFPYGALPVFPSIATVPLRKTETRADRPRVAYGAFLVLSMCWSISSDPAMPGRSPSAGRQRGVRLDVEGMGVGGVDFTGGDTARGLLPVSGSGSQQLVEGEKRSPGRAAAWRCRNICAARAAW